LEKFYAKYFEKNHNDDVYIEEVWFEAYDITKAAIHAEYEYGNVFLIKKLGIFYGDDD
jgi:hypothetical protein